jgi:hypothetical protein
MPTHPLHSLGFEPIAQQTAPAVARRGGKGGIVKGTSVRLADGTLAKVAWVDPEARIARVRTADGRNITVRHRSLRGSAA